MTKLPSHRLLLLGILLLAAVLRFWQLNDFPPGLYHDEAYNGLDALSLLQSKTFPQFYEGWELYAQDAHADRPARETKTPLFFEGNYGREPLHIYFMALSIAIFGATPFAIRAVPAFFGVLAVLTTYLVTKAVLNDNKRSALLAAFFLAILMPAIHFSRFGLRVMLFLPISTLAVYTFWRGIQQSDKTTKWFLLSGSLLGIALYSYASARLLPLVFAGFMLIWFLLDRPKASTFIKPFLLLTGASILVAAPLLVYYAQYPYFLLFRSAFVANKGKGVIDGQPWLTRLYNTGRVFRGLIWQGETHLRHNLPGRPFLGLVQAAVFLLGLIQTLRNPRHLPHIFLWLWTLVMLLPSILSGDAPHFGRMMGAAPPLAILCAIGMNWLWDNLPTERTLAAGLVGVLLASSTLITVFDYFGRYRQHPDLATDFYLDDWQLGEYADTQPDDASLYLVPNQEEMATIYFALEDPERMHSFNASGTLLPVGQPERAAVYFVREEGSAVIDQLDVYPDLFDYGTNNSTIALTLPGFSNRFPNNIIPTDLPLSDSIGLVGFQLTPAANTYQLDFYWQALKRLPHNYTFFVHLADETGTVVAQVDREPAGYPTADWRVGEIIGDKFELAIPPNLAAGTYSLNIGFYHFDETQSIVPHAPAFTLRTIAVE